MKKFRTYLTLLRVATLLLFGGAFLSRCASIMTPTGGPKDSLPPVIVALDPDNFSTNRPLTGHKPIYIEFNEFIQIKDQHKEFFTSPAMKKKPLITQRGKGIVIQLRDTLEPNTTYSLNFGGAIRDNNEGNPLNSMRYVFSTGETCDSMVISGYTADSYKADSVSKSYIWCFAVDSIEQVGELDSTIFKFKPDVIGRAENNGIFIAQNLKPIPYRIYAIQDKNDNQMYEPGSDQVGFLDEVYNPAELPDFAIWFDSLRAYYSAEPQLYFRMFTDVAFRRQVLQESLRPQQRQVRLLFSAAHPRIEEIAFDSIPSDKIIIEHETIGRDTLSLWLDVEEELLPDTLKGHITYFRHDTANMLQPHTEELKLSWRKIESKEEEKERERLERERKRAEAAGEEWQEPEKENPFKHNIPAQAEINPEEHLSFEVDYPLTEIDSARILLTRTLDDGQTTEDCKVHFVRDTAKMRLWHIRSEWKEGGTYTLTIPEGALKNVAREQNDTIVCRITPYDPEKYATVLVEVRSTDPSTSYIVQLLDANNRQLQQKEGIKRGVAQFNYVKPGEVQIRVVEDKNSNGKWDTGNVVERRQPERTELYINDQGESLFATKANWDIELTIDMDQLFAPVTMQSLQEMLDEREMQRLKKLREKELLERAKNGGHDHNHNSMGSSNSMMGGFGGGMGGALGSTGGMFNSIR